MVTKMTFISQQEQWAQVARDLQAEQLKLASYDQTLLGLLGDVQAKKFLDYGCGPGVLALALTRGRADVKAYDISTEMRRLVGDKIGAQNVYERIEEIPTNYFDIAICNLVVCIVDDAEVRRIVKNVGKVVAQEARAYVGFCNPRIFNVLESRLDLREPTGQPYESNHRYCKKKKEGGYKIVEEHRPLSWYEEAFIQAGLKLVGTHFTPEYELKGKQIQDFVIFELERE